MTDRNRGGDAILRKTQSGSTRADDVELTFRACDGEFVLKASVRLGPEEMIIDIPEQEESCAYLVRGKRVEYFFAGVDSLIHELKVNVIARWALLGDLYVGIWREDGEEFLFSFRVPKKRAYTGD